MLNFNLIKINLLYFKPDENFFLPHFLSALSPSQISVFTLQNPDTMMIKANKYM